MSGPVRIVSHSPDETREIGRLLGQGAEAGDVFLLTGSLGAGKTCLTQGIAWGLGVSGYARSPTFVMIARYRGRLTLHHVDLFRTEGPDEAIDLGLEEYLSGDDVCVVEWADRAEEIFPADAMRIFLDYGEQETDRSIAFHPATDRHRRLLKGIPEAVEAGSQGDVLAEGRQ